MDDWDLNCAMSVYLLEQTAIQEYPTVHSDAEVIAMLEADLESDLEAIKKRVDAWAAEQARSRGMVTR